MILDSKLHNDSNRYDLDIKALVINQGITCKQGINDDDDLNFVMSNKNIPQI